MVIGAGGMGTSAARRLGNHYRIILVDIDARVAEERAAMRADGYDARHHRCDITDPASVDRLADAVAAAGPLRAIGHVAAKSPSMRTWREILTLNLIGAAHVERAMLHLVEQGTAAVFVSSVAAHLVRDPGPETIALLDDPLASGFFAALEKLVAEQTPDAIEFLLSSRASYITGVDLLVDGGVSAATCFPEERRSRP